ncbi:MAG TPA: hypothetical protein VN795_02985 [Stellaceae bacterium]|nr:hypothetical protein [Stellaceae bacterium]
MKIPIGFLAVAAVLSLAAEPAAWAQGSGAAPPSPKDISGSWRMEQGSCIGNISISAPANAAGAAWTGRYSARCDGNASMNAQYQISANANGEYRFTGTPTSGGLVFSEEIVLTWTSDGKALIGTGTESAQGKSSSVDVSMHH